MISDEQLSDWNSEGLIPGPDEDEASFLDRVKYCYALKKEFEKEFPFKPEEKAPEGVLSTFLQTSKSLFDIAPKWIPVYFSNYQLSPWHGGCAWIFQTDERSPTGALLQLRQAFKDSSHYLKIYSRDELIAHELAHVGRMAFQEPKFEEFHAYRTAKSSFRKWFGPICRSARESLFFLLLLIIVLFVNLTMMKSLNCINVLPPAFIFAAIARLWWNQRQYTRCLNRLEKIFPNNALKVIYRLTDGEIEAFAEMESEEVKAYIDAEKSLRWRAIIAAYSHPS